MESRLSPEWVKAKEAATAVPQPTAREVASYLVDLIKGTRTLVRDARREDFAFLDYLLAMAEDEASTLAANTRH